MDMASTIVMVAAARTLLAGHHVADIGVGACGTNTATQSYPESGIPTPDALPFRQTGSHVRQEARPGSAARGTTPASDTSLKFL